MNSLTTEKWSFAKDTERHLGVVLQQNSIDLVEVAHEIYIAFMDDEMSRDEYFGRMRAIFHMICTPDLEAFEKCSHQNTPIGMVVREVLMERMLLS